MAPHAAAAGSTSMRMTQLVASLFTSQGKALLSYPCYFETTFNPWGEAKQIKIKTDPN